LFIVKCHAKSDTKFDAKFDAKFDLPPGARRAKNDLTEAFVNLPG